MRERADWWAPAIAAASVVGIAWLALLENIRRGEDVFHIVSGIVPGLIIVGSGLAIRSHRAGNRLWWVLLSAGAAWFVGDFEHTDYAALSQAAFILGQWHVPLLAVAVLAFPSGRLASLWARALAISAVCIWVVRGMSRLLLFVPPDVAGFGTRNPFLPIDDGRWWRLVDTGSGFAISAVMAGMLLLLARQWARSSAVGRRLLTPVVVAATILFVVVVVQYVAGWNSAWLGLGIYSIVWWSYGGVAIALVWGIRRLRATRSTVVDLVGDLTDAAPTRVADAVGEALGDPSLSILVWSPAAGAYLDARGAPTEPRAPAQRTVTRIEHRGSPVAALIHDSALLEDPGTLRAICTVVALTLDNASLAEQLERQLEEVDASRARLVAAGDTERRRIERDLHDGAQQRLVSVALSLKLAETRLVGVGDDATRAMLSRAVADLAEALTELRDLARGIHPSILSELGLRAALESLADRTPVPVSLDVEIPADMPRVIEATAYFAASEALTNVVKHGEASQVVITGRVADGRLRLSIVDDGRGGADPSRGTGLGGISDRVHAVGGTFRVSSPSGGGTRFEVDLPCG